MFGYVEWCLGPPRAGERRFVVTELDEATGALLARNAYNTEFGERVAFWHATERAAIVHRRPRRVRRPQPHADARRRRSSASELAGATGAGLDPCGALQLVLRARAGRVASRRVRARPGARPRACDRAGRALRLARRRRRRRSPSAERMWDETLGAVQVQHARRFVRSDRESLAALSDAELPHLGAQRPLPAGRRVRLPRSAAGRAGADVRAAGSVPRAPAARRVAAVRRGRRAALVAPAERARHAHALLRRPALAAVRGRRVRLADRRRVGARRSGAVPRGAAARARPVRGLHRCRASSSRDGVAVRALRPRHQRTR